MIEPILLGVPFTADFDIDPESEEKLKALVAKEKKEIEAMGATVTGIHVLGEGASPRYFIQFPKGVGSFTFRTKLESKQFDVGQQMGDKILKFYASRRTKRGEGWQV